MIWVKIEVVLCTRSKGQSCDVGEEVGWGRGGEDEGRAMKERSFVCGWRRGEHSEHQFLVMRRSE